MTETLPVKLTDAELLARGRESGELALAIQQVHEELAAAKLAAKEKLKAFEARDRELDRQLRSGTEDRDVECEIKFDFDAGTASTVRLDTGEIIGVRPVTDEERQATLDVAMFAPAKESRRVREAGKRNPVVVAGPPAASDANIDEFMARQDARIKKQTALGKRKGRAA